MKTALFTNDTVQVTNQGPARVSFAVQTIEPFMKTSETLEDQVQLCMSAKTARSLAELLIKRASPDNPDTANLLQLCVNLNGDLTILD